MQSRVKRVTTSRAVLPFAARATTDEGVQPVGRAKRTVKPPLTPARTAMGTWDPSAISRTVTSARGPKPSPRTTSCSCPSTRSVGRVAALAQTTTRSAQSATTTTEVTRRTPRLWPSPPRTTPTRTGFLHDVPAENRLLGMQLDITRNRVISPKRGSYLQFSIMRHRVLAACQGRDIAFCSGCPRSFVVASSRPPRNRAGASTRRSSRGSRRA